MILCIQRICTCPLAITHRLIAPFRYVTTHQIRVPPSLTSVEVARIQPCPLPISPLMTLDADLTKTHKQIFHIPLTPRTTLPAKSGGAATTRKARELYNRHNSLGNPLLHIGKMIPRIHFKDYVDAKAFKMFYHRFGAGLYSLKQGMPSLGFFIAQGKIKSIRHSA